MGPTQEPRVSHSQHRRNRERFWKKNAGEWSGRVEIGKEEIPGSKRGRHGHTLTYSQRCLRERDGEGGDGGSTYGAYMWI